MVGFAFLAIGHLENHLSSVIAQAKIAVNISLTVLQRVIGALALLEIAYLILSYFYLLFCLNHSMIFIPERKPKSNKKNKTVKEILL